MADGIHANYGKIGFALLLGVAGIVGTLVWLGGAGSGKDFIPAETYFNTPVSGLAVGSDVCFRGVKVGSVKRISFVGNEYAKYKPNHGSAIWVGMSIDPRLCGYRESGDEARERMREIIAKGLHATLAANILTGIAHIEMNFPKMPIANEPINWKPRSLCVPPAPTLLESASDTLPDLIAKLGKIDFVGGWSNMVDTVSSAGTLMESANTLIDSQQGSISEIISNLRDTSAALKEFSIQIRDNPSLLIRSSDPPPLPETRTD
ncbi:MAG: MCE family protein [Kiritimatiellae bacterium]|nr:MCE family protein [Kiritimatiellia bacterium]